MQIRRSIEGTIYDTSKAEWAWNLVSRNLGSDDFHTEHTDLYRTAAGQWFIAGRGGACTRWHQDHPHNREATIAGEGIKLVDSDGALEFMINSNGPVEAYFELEAA